LTIFLLSSTDIILVASQQSSLGWNPPQNAQVEAGFPSVATREAAVGTLDFVFCLGFVMTELLDENGCLANRILSQPSTSFFKNSIIFSNKNSLEFPFST
jgi:hypothetical protein